jgi:transcription elongation factor GreA
MQRFKITKKGYEELKEKLNHLLNVERPAVSKAIGEAIEMGDLSENAEYSSAKDKQVIIENSIANLSDLLSRADIVDTSKLTGNIIDFGATVELIDEDTEKEVVYTLVSEVESNLEENKISIESPVGRALIGKSVGDEIEIKIPSGTKYYEVINIKWK